MLFMIGQPPPLGVQGSITVEASLVVPIFFFAIYTFLFMILIVGCQDEVGWAMARLAREAAIENAMTDQKLLRSKTYLASKLSNYVDGSQGVIHLTDSRIMEENDKIDLVADYEIALPIALFAIDHVSVIQRVHTRAFVGVETRSPLDVSDEEVYIAETGTVFHRDGDCTYLKLSISQVLYRDLPGLRNESGGRYLPCESCSKNLVMGADCLVYIANYGDRFHRIRTCSRIKRTVKKVHLSQVGNRHPCSKCGNE